MKKDIKKAVAQRPNRFYYLGQFIYPLRWAMIALWIVSILACIPFLPHIISPFKTTGFIDENSQSAKTQSYLNKKLGYNKDSQFIIMYQSESLRANDRVFRDKIEKSLSRLDEFSLKHEIFLPQDNPSQISKDKHTAYVVVMVKSKQVLNDDFLEEFTSLVKRPSKMTMEIGGEPLFIEALNKQTQKDLFHADMIATPMAIITLVLVFGTLISALLPIVLGGGCAVVILTLLYFLGHVFSLSVFTINIALLLGLCLSLDYALFIISRFRDELERGLSTREAIAVTQGTAGKAIFFSGLAVFVSLSALLLFPINILFSVAVGGLTAVFVAVSTAVFFLPAILSVLNHRINRFPVKIFKTKSKDYAGIWHRLAEKVVYHPWRCLIGSLIILLSLGYPLLSIKLGVSDFHIFPEKSEGRRFFDVYAEEFKEQELTPISMVVESKRRTSILSRTNLNQLYALGTELKDNPLISKVSSIVNTDPRLTRAQYYTLYHLPKSRMDPNIKKLLETTTRHYFTVFTIVSRYQVNSVQMNSLLTELHNTSPGRGLTARLAGVPVGNADVLTTIHQHLPEAILWIMVFTYIILLVLLRSLLLPLKAIAMNLLSLSACYGALVFIFQEGHLHQLLNFQAQGMLDISMLVIIFCALFGFSMDYEVFLLTRIKESFLTYHDNKKSIVFGIEKSSRIITSAALIVIVLCGSFLVADVLMVKAFGLGIAVAILVDAFLIRTILVPAVMSLMNTWNWYLPHWMEKILPRW